MNVSQADLYRIIVEEYVREEGIDESKVDDLIAHIKGGPRPDWMGDDEREVPPPPDVPKPEERDDSSTYPMEAPPGADMSDEDIVDSISRMIQGRDPEHVSELFQAVFSKIPGVELGDAEEEPESLYSPGAEGRPVAGFKMEELMELIQEVLKEGHYHDMGGDDEIYDALDPHGFNEMSDGQLIDMLHTDGMEELVVFDGEGGLANREEVIATLKDV